MCTRYVMGPDWRPLIRGGRPVRLPDGVSPRCDQCRKTAAWTDANREAMATAVEHEAGLTWHRDYWTRAASVVRARELPRIRAIQTARAVAACMRGGAA